MDLTLIKEFREDAPWMVEGYVTSVQTTKLHTEDNPEHYTAHYQALFRKYDYSAAGERAKEEDKVQVCDSQNKHKIGDIAWPTKSTQS